MAKFEDAFLYMIHNEVGGDMVNGGYTVDPDDPGGETRWGISKSTYPNVDIKNLTLDGAKAIYLRDYWRFSGINDQRVATKVFDHYVNRKATIQQVQVAAGAIADGIYGGNTEHAINVMDPAVFLQNFVNGLIAMYNDLIAKNPKLAKYKNGWLNRARRLP